MIIMQKMADGALSPPKKRRKTEKKASVEKEEIEKHKKSVKRIGKPEKTGCIVLIRRLI